MSRRPIPLYPGAGSTDQCCRQSLIGGGCPDPVAFLVTGPSGQQNPMCERHAHELMKRWAKPTGFTLELINTPESLGILGFTLTKGSRSAQNLNGRKE